MFNFNRIQKQEKPIVSAQEKTQEQFDKEIIEETDKLNLNLTELKNDIDTYGGVENIKEKIANLVESEEEGKTLVKGGIGLSAVFGAITVLEVVAQLDQSQSSFFEYLRENSIGGNAGLTAFVTGMLTLIPLIATITSKFDNRKIRKQIEEEEVGLVLKTGGYQGKKMG